MERKELRKIIESFELVYKAAGDAIKSLEELSEAMGINDRGVYIDSCGDIGRWLVYHDEYVVLEGYKPPKTKKKK